MAKLMNWHEFERVIKEKQVPLFSPTDVARLFDITKVAVSFLLHRYAKRGLLVRIKRGLYAFPTTLPPDFFIANKLYEPSYLSRELALSYHRIIPETVYEMTSVTPKATRRFETLDKIYSYRRIKQPAFAGYQLAKQSGFGFFIADPEKAFVDANYFRLLDGLGPIARFDKKKIQLERALCYAALFEHQRLMDRIEAALR